MSNHQGFLRGKCDEGIKVLRLLHGCNGLLKFATTTRANFAQSNKLDIHELVHSEQPSQKIIWPMSSQNWATLFMSNTAEMNRFFDLTSLTNNFFTSLAEEPINLCLFISIFILIYMLRHASSQVQHVTASHPPVTELQAFSREQLENFKGLNNGPVYLAVDGVVFDVSRLASFCWRCCRGRQYYGPGWSCVFLLTIRWSIWDSGR